MSESKTIAEPLAERIANALAERRPRPSSDFEARLERASERAHQPLMTGLLAAAVVACAILRVVVMRPDPEFRAAVSDLQQLPSAAPAPKPAQTPAPKPAQTPAPRLPHEGRYSTNQCNQCHRRAPPPLTFHQMNGGFPLVGAHSTVACATCHVAGKQLQPQCSNCHTDPHRGARGPACADCHPPGSWKTK